MSGSALAAQRFRGRAPTKSLLSAGGKSLRERLREKMQRKRDREKTSTANGATHSGIQADGASADPLVDGGTGRVGPTKETGGAPPQTESDLESDRMSKQ